MNFINDLNEKQYEAVTSSLKYNRIIAGAGSGKTRVLTYRLAYQIEENNILPYRLLAITFTNKVAKEMKERTIALLPNYDLKELKISTFHSFCNYFLRREIEVLNFPRSFDIIDEEDQEKLIKDIAIEKGYRKGDEIVSNALNFINYHKMKGELPSDVKTSFMSQEQKVLLDFFIEYEKRKNRQFSLDFDDLLIYTVKILKTNLDIKEKYNNRFLEILVDEFQDTNNLQYELLLLLAGENTGIYVVGDPDQTIYTWRGANQRVILDIDKDFKGMETIILNENFRSTKNILSHANSLIAFNKERIKKDLFTNRNDGDNVIVHSSESSEMEARWVINKILELKSLKKADYKDCAILYRSSFSSRLFEKELVYNHIPYQIYSGIRFYERAEIKDILAYLKLLINPLDDISFLRIINVPRRGFGPQAINLIKKEASENDLSLYNYALNIKKYNTLLSKALLNKLAEFTNLIEEYKEKVNDKAESYSEILLDFITRLDYFEYLAKIDEEEEKISNVKELVNDIRSFLKDNPDSTLDEYLQNITLLTQQDQMKDNSNVVSLMTVHTAKGLEFKDVFVVNFTDNIFPNQRSVSEGGSLALEEERRLAYVAFTRAMDKLFVTFNYGYSYIDRTGSLPSRFIKEADLVYTRPNSFGFDHSKITPTSPLYSINFGNKSNKKINEEKPNVISYEVNSIAWKIGDKLEHDVFGEGEVKAIEGNIIVVDFTDFGIKKMLGNHKMLKKKE